MELELRDKGAIVTGASRGIGFETARLLCREGARVVISGRDENNLQKAAEACERESADPAESVQPVVLDVTEPDAGERLVATCEENFGPADIVVNNAGTSFIRPLTELTDDDWQAQWELNVMAPLRLMRAVAPRMAERGDGRIVNVCSTSGKRPSLRNAAYSVTKAAQLSLSRTFADAYARQGVLVNAVAPGPVESDLWMARGGLADQVAEQTGADRDRVLAEARERVPTGRFSTPQEIAAVVVFLCSGRAGNVTGAAWSADGGTVPIIL